MESYSYAAVCDVWKKPIIVLRSITDFCETEFSITNFPEFKANKFYTMKEFATKIYNKIFSPAIFNETMKKNAELTFKLIDFLIKK